MKAYNLLFGADPGALRMAPQATRPVVAPDAVRAGWFGSLGPRLGTAWPRSPQTRFPMTHVLTIRLPEEYQRRGPSLPGIAFYGGEGECARPAGGLEDISGTDPFLVDLATATINPNEQQFEDGIGGAWALVWLTQDQLDSGPCAKPADPRRPGEHIATDEGLNAWDTDEPVVPLWLDDRKDRNAGLVPVGEPQADDDYEDPFWDAGDERVRDKSWAQNYYDPCFSHLGGTAFPQQGVPPGLTAYYLELEELGVMNFGGGNAQIDLDSGVFDWACG